jgi:DNA end-binding protein Ku
MATARAPEPNPAALPAGTAPAGRPSWSGLVQLSLVSVPVKAYPAVCTTETTHFNQLHADCGQRIRYEKRCPIHGPVDGAAIVKGYPYAPDQYVIVEPAELDQLRPPQDRALRLERFIDPAHVDPRLFAGRSLYLTPDGLAAQRPYAVLAQTLRTKGKWAIGRVVLAGHRQLILLRATPELLVVDVLYYPAQLRAAPEGRRDAAGGLPAEELQLAGLLMDAASGPVDWPNYRDERTAELAALIEAKVAGRPLVGSTAAPVAVLPLLEALKQSVAAAQATSAAPEASPAKARRRRTA